MIKLPRDMIEAMALRWATMDGKRQRFLDDKAGLLGEEDGCYEGYMVEAEELLKAALATVLSEVHEAGRREEREECAKICDSRMYDFGCIAGTEAYDFVTLCADLAAAIRSREVKG